MAKRGRKSAAEQFSVVVTLPGQRPEPLESLAEEEAAVWRRIVASLPHDWFAAGTYILLADYCRRWVRAERLADVIKKQPEETSIRDRIALYENEDDNSKLMMALATKMRITQQSKYTTKAAGTAANSAGPARKPWERS